MTDLELEVTDSFERVFPVPTVVADWDDVLDRVGAEQPHHTRSFRRRRLVAIAVAGLVAALLVSPGIGLGSRLLDLIQGPFIPPDVSQPAWSPDGRRIAFQRHGGDWFGDTYVINADGSGEHELTRDVQGVTWSPDGRQIAFANKRSGEI